MFEALFKGVSTRFGLRTIEKYVGHLDFLFCSSFQNLRLGSIHLEFSIDTSSMIRHAIVVSTDTPAYSTRTHAPFKTTGTRAVGRATPPLKRLARTPPFKPMDL